MKKRIAETISVPQLYRMFPDDAACRKWLEDVRWGGEPCCPRCGSLDDIRVAPPSKPAGHYWCKACRRFFTVTIGTFMHSTKADLQHWIYAIYSILTGRKGISAMQLSKSLACSTALLGTCCTAFARLAARGEFKLDNVVEADETHIGGKEKNKHESKKLKVGRGTVGKTAVAGLRERGGRVIAKPVEKVDARTLVPFIKDNVKPGAAVYTDESSAYARLPFDHESVCHSAGEYVRGPVSTNSIEAVWAVFKRTIYGTWHHVSPKHLGRYVNEATFRLNEGNCEVDTLDRMEAVIRQMGGARLSYSDLIADNGLSSKAESK